MRWQTKAMIQKICALLPASGRLYRFVQKNFSRLKARPMGRIPMQVEMSKWILEMNLKVEGRTFFEVGTGHCPIVLIGFFLCGAGQVVTVDLPRRLDIGILEKSLVWLAENRDEVFGYYDGVAKRTVFDERMDLTDSLKKMPEKFLSEANIQYLAPADAADIGGLPDVSVDYHISTTVFEHIPGADIKRILEEAKRILKDDGIVIHFIDLSDHFQHQDKSITRINFLRYSDEEWEKIAGNQFAHCNRMRASDYLTLFKEAGFDMCRCENLVDDEARVSIRDGFMVDERFRNYSIDDLCVTRLKVALKENRKATGI